MDENEKMLSDEEQSALEFDLASTALHALTAWHKCLTNENQMSQREQLWEAINGIQALTSLIRGWH
jgi:hypothetical protein